MRNITTDIVRKTVLFLCLVTCFQTALAAKPEYVTDKSARWEFKKVTAKNRSISLFSQVNIQGSKFSISYDAHNAKLSFHFQDKGWIEHVGEITVNGKMLAAYGVCYEGESPACDIRGNDFELYLDSESIAQLKKGSELRTTIKFADAKLRTFAVPLSGSTSSLNQLQQEWKKAGTTELMFALLHRDSAKTKSLIKSGHSVMVVDKAGRTPMSIVLRGQYYDDEITEQDKTLIRLLVKSGYDINHVRREPLLHEHIGGKAPLEFIKFLLELGVDPNLKNSKGEPPIVEIANREEFKALYRMLVAAGANKHAIDELGMNLMHRVALTPKFASSEYKQASKKMKFLLEEGFDINLKIDEGMAPFAMTPIVCAAYMGNKDIIKLLVQKGAVTNPSGKDGKKVQDQLRDEISRKSEGSNEQIKLKNTLYYLENAAVITIVFKNKTSAWAQIAVRYKNRDGEWVTREWYTIAPGEEIDVAKTNNLIFYWFGIASDGKWKGTDKYYYVQGYDEKQGFRKKTMNKKYRGDVYTVSLTD